MIILEIQMYTYYLQQIEKMSPNPYLIKQQKEPDAMQDNDNQIEDNNRSINHIQQYHHIGTHHQYEIHDLLLNKSYLDYFRQDNICQMFTISHNQEEINPPPQYHQIKPYQEPYIKTQNLIEPIENQHIVLLNWNHIFDHHDYDIKKQEIQQSKPYNFKSQRIDYQISRYIYPMQVHTFNQKPNQIQEKLKLQEITQKAKSVRSQKVKRYLEKKKNRCFSKKITYACRKVVADRRIRLKGRFINYHQAVNQLGLDPANKYDCSELKRLIKQQLETQNS